MRAYFSKRLSHVRRPDPAPVFCVCCVHKRASERASKAVLERPRSRLWLNSLFGESHVPVVFSQFDSQSFSSQCCLLFVQKLYVNITLLCLLQVIYGKPKNVSSKRSTLSTLVFSYQCSTCASTKLMNSCAKHKHTTHIMFWSPY